MEKVIINIINSYGYIGVFFMIFLENIFPPIPSEIILLFSGFMTRYTNFTIAKAILISTTSSTLGALILYYFGYFLNTNILDKIINGKIGKILKINNNDIEKTNKHFQIKGQKAVFYCRCIPILRSLISLPAGINKMNKVNFITYTFAGSLIWNTLLILLGNILGRNWKNILKIIKIYSKIVIFILIVASIFFIKKKK